MKIRKLLTFLLVFCVTAAWAQKINITMKNAPIKSVLNEITVQTGYKFVYNESLKVLDSKVDFDFKSPSIKIKEVLSTLFNKTNIVYLIKDKQIVLSEKKSGNTMISDLKGTVTDSQGEPLIGVSISNPNLEKGVFSDINGRFAIPSKIGDVIQIAFIGMVSQDVVINNLSKDLKIIMQPDNILLNDVVVIGYGSKEKQSITSSISSIRKDDLQKLSSTSTTLDDMLGGTIKGVLSVQSSGAPGAAPRINVRGITSPYPNLSGQSGNVPLYVIDGVPIFLDNNTMNPLLSIAPSDVESIVILKDASATAIYGSRGANGVIIVKTKSGKKREDLKVSFNYNVSMSNPVKTHKSLSREEFMSHTDMLLSNTVTAMNNYLSSGSMYYMQSLYDPTFPNVFKLGKLEMDMNTGQIIYNGLNLDSFGSANTDWGKEITNKNALTHNYNIGITGSTEKITYSVSLNGLNQEGTYINDKMNHYGARVTLDAQISKGVKAGFVLNNAYSKRKSGSATNTSTVSYWLMRPDMPVYAEDGGFQRIDLSPLYLSSAEGANPVARRQGKDLFKANQITGNMYVIVDLLKGLSARGDFSLANFKYDNSSFTPQKAIDLTTFDSKNSTVTTSNSNNYNTSLNFRLDYTANINKHMIGAMVGFGSDRSNYNSSSITYEGFPNDDYLTNPSSAQKVKSYSDLVSKGGLNSFYSRINYSYDNRYLAELSMRADESSKFGPKNRWGFFPAISLGWLMSNENFLKNSKIVDNLKVRFSLGRTGSTNVADFSYRQYMERNSDGLYGGELSISLKDLLPNKGIKWEMTTEYNAGVDFSFFESRLFGSVDAYYRNTDGALAPAPHTLESGLTTYYDNLLDMSNKGLEIELGGDIIRNNNFTWTSVFNLALNRNKIKKLNGASITSMMQDAYVEGMPAGTLKGYVVEKIFQNQGEIDVLNKKAVEAGFYDYQSDVSVGDYMFKDLNGDGTINSKDRTVIANPEPKFFGGWSNNLRYKNLGLSFLFQYSVGGEALYNELITDATGQMSAGVSREMFNNTWTPENTTAKYAKLVSYAYNSMNWTKNDRFVFKTSYLRLKNLTLSYNLPQSFMKRFSISSAQVFVTGSNLFTISKWPGLDPELLGSSVTLMSVGYDSYPLSRTYTFGIKLIF